MAPTDTECEECGAVNGITQIQMRKEGLEPPVKPVQTDEIPKREVEDIGDELVFPMSDSEPKNIKNDPSPLLSTVKNTDINPINLDKNPIPQSTIVEPITTPTPVVEDPLSDLDEPDEALAQVAHNGRNQEAVLSSPVSATAKREVPKEVPKEIPNETFKEPIRELYSSDKKPKKTVSNKILVIIIAVLIAAFGGYIAISKGLVGDSSDDRGNTASAFPVTTEETSTTLPPVYDAYSYAEVYLTTADGAQRAIEGVVNGYACGQIISFNVTADDGKATVKTDEYEIVFRLQDPSINEEYFKNKEITVIGSALYDTISAEKIFLYDASSSELTTLAPVTTETPTTTEAPTLELVTASEAPKTTTKQTTTKKTTTTKPTTTKPKTTKSTTAAISNVSIQYISSSEAERLMNEWRTDGSKLGSSNAYFGTIRDGAIIDGAVNLHTAGYKIVFKCNENVSIDDLVERNILVVGKAQSDGTIRASKVYIY